MVGDDASVAGSDGSCFWSRLSWACREVAPAATLGLSAQPGRTIRRQSVQAGGGGEARGGPAKEQQSFPAWVHQPPWSWIHTPDFVTLMLPCWEAF